MKKFIFGCFIANFICGLNLESPCNGKPDGTHIPNDTDCNKFMLCDGNMGLTLSCRTSDPYFNRCNETCVKELSACSLRECPGSSNTTGSTTASTTTTVSPASNASTTTYRPPTVPTTCPIPCTEDNKPAECSCLEQWTCSHTTKLCVYDATTVCPMTKAECEADTECGCASRCECEDPEETKCSCNKDIVCPFVDEGGACVATCGCQNNCDCTTNPDGCVCKDVCACIEPPPKCPFGKDKCIDSCGCDDRCICNGPYCHCDGDNACPK